MTALLRRTSSDLGNVSRATQRKLRLLEVEKEQRIEEAEALKMTDEQHQALLRSFISVKVEFCDLDGLSWTCSALRARRLLSRAMPIFQSRSPSSSPSEPAFVILTDADLATFAPEDTIRASSSRFRSHFTSRYLSGSQRLFHSALRYQHRDGTHTKPPVEVPQEGAFEHLAPAANGVGVARGRIRRPAGPRLSCTQDREAIFTPTPTSLGRVYIKYSPLSD